METSKSKERQFVSVDPDKCNGCSLCEYVCAIEKEGFPDLSRSRIRVIRLNPWINVAMTCIFCEDALCVRACPRGALEQSERGIPIVDEDKCNACCWCLQACPHGGIVLHPEKRVVTCDLCNGEPKCVEFCPEEALELVSDDKASEKMWISAITRLPSKIETLTNLIKKRDWTELFVEAEERAKRLEEKLEALSRRELEIQRVRRT